MEDDGSMKRPLDDDYDSDGDSKRRRGDGPKVELRFLLASKNAGAIIGKGGSNIKRLRQDYKASVTVPDSTSPERVLTIGANLGTALDCLLDIIPKLEDYKNCRDDDFDCEMRLLVHQSQAGCIIGRAGFKIKELREKTGAQIKVYSQCCPESTERVVAIGGKPKIVVDCIDTIHNLLQTAPPKGPNQPYDPLYWDEFMVPEYGGFTSSEGGRGKGGPRGAPQQRGRMGGPMGGMRGRGNMGGMRGGGGGGNMRNQGRGGGGGYGGGNRQGGFGGGMGNQRPNRGGMRGGNFGGSGGNYGGGSGNMGMGGGNMGMGGGNMGMGGGGGMGMGSGGMGGGGSMGGNQGDDFKSFGGDNYGDNYGGGDGYDEGYDGYGGMQNFSQDNTTDLPVHPHFPKARRLLPWIDRNANQGGMGQMFGNDGNMPSTQVTIPKDLAGAIIGKGGSRIQEIRRQSNAQVVIDEALPGSSDRIITITGTDEQIQNAQYLLQMRIDTSNKVTINMQR